MFKQAVDYISGLLPCSPSIGMILGSGLGNLADTLQNKIVIPYKKIPGFPQTTVKGHNGNFIYGNYDNKKVLVMQGRFHYYEGKKPSEIALPIRMMKAVGINTLIITNSSGGINLSFNPGNIMLITDHINLSGINPLIGENYDEVGPRFPDMTYAYDIELRQKALKAAAKLNLDLKTGIYAMMSGPSYETPAEINMLRILGADAVGMSTVPEVITAVHANIKVLGISCITNMAAGILDRQLDHNEVVSTATSIKNDFSDFINAILSEL